MNTVADRMNSYVSQKGIKKTHLAKTAGMPYGTVACLLNGQRRMTVEQYQQLCSALGVRPSFFMEEADPEWAAFVTSPTPTR